MAKIIYPLEEVLSVKKRRVEDAERVVAEKEEILRKEQAILKEREEARDKVRNHYIDKMDQLRKTMDEGSTSPKIQQMKYYLKTVDEKLVVEEKKVSDQQEQVELAQKNVDIARADLKQRRLEVDKLQTHKKDWIKEMRREMQIAEDAELDEIGNIIYTLNRRK